MNTDIAMAVEGFHLMADEANDAKDHDELHAAGAVLALLNGAILTDKEADYIARWIEGLAKG